MTKKEENRMSENKVLCIVCAWRATCQKQFSMKAGQKCPEFVRDLTLKEKSEEIKDKN
jgi:transcription initiation factor IIE alpha subunit